MTPEEFEAGHQLSNSPTGVQPRPTKSSTSDGKFDGNYLGGTENISIIQLVTVLFDLTHSHHLIK
jgi:hypothetical protein